ncbi:MAG: DUF1552 domain-containing protein [Lentisphaeraceae bacterium]|nr:DUF1552 domain-containing protein [Lentisphaeraceae bacterium]
MYSSLIIKAFDIFKNIYLSDFCILKNSILKAAKARLKKQEHLLNEVYSDAKALKLQLGKEDQVTMDEYLSSLSELEKKIENDKFWANRLSAQKAPNLNLEIGKDDVENYIQTMYELIYLAFKSDITRVATYQIASEGGDSPVGQMSKFLGLNKDIHGLSHGAGKGDSGYKDWGTWDQFIAKQFSYFIKRLKETKEGDG